MKNIRLTIAIPAVCMLLATGRAQAIPPTMPGSEVLLRSTIAAANAGFIDGFKRGDAAMATAAYAADAVYVGPGVTYSGRSEIAHFFARSFRKARLTSGACKTKSLVMRGSVASEYGACDLAFQVGKRQAVSKGDYVTVWVLREGQWKIQINTAP